MTTSGRAVSLPESWRDEPMAQVLTFARGFGPNHAALAMHAAVPLGLTPELLHIIRLNLVSFAPWIAEADLLLSPVCQDLGGGFYQMNREVRDLLLDELRSDAAFGEARLLEVADLLLAFVGKSLQTAGDVETRSFLLAQEWTALAYLQPELAAQSIAAALKDGLNAGRGPDVLRIANLAQALAAPLYAEEKVLLYAAGVEKLATGQTALGVRFLEALGPTDKCHEVHGVPLPSADEIRRSVERKHSTDTTPAKRHPSAIESGSEEGMTTQARIEEPAKPEPIESPKHIELQFTAYWPKAVQPEKWYPVFVFAHSPDDFSVIYDSARQRLGAQFAEYQKRTQHSDFSVLETASLTLLPEGMDFEFDTLEPGLTLGMGRNFFEFSFRTSDQVANRSLFGGLSIFHDSKLLAEITWKVLVSTFTPLRVFLCYRRDDSSEVTGRIYDKLRSHFEQKLIVFRDVENIPLGRDFREVIAEAFVSCDVLLAVIGPSWVDTRNEDGERRLDDPNDLVRLEIEIALKRKIPVIPLLVSRALMPKPTQLPDSLQPLAFRNGLEVRRDPHFHNDMDGLIRALTAMLVRSPGEAANKATEEQLEREALEKAENEQNPIVKGENGEEQTADGNEIAHIEPQKPLVFLSYAASDMETVSQICRHLEELGIVCWFAPRDVATGVVYLQSVVRAIEETTTTVVFLSANSNSSQHVSREVEKAISKRKHVIPVRLEDVLPGPSLELLLATFHWLDAWRLSPQEVAVKLAEAVRHFSEKTETPTVSSESSESAEIPQRSQRAASATPDPGKSAKKRLSFAILGLQGTGKTLWQMMLQNQIENHQFPSGIQLEVVQSDGSAKLAQCLRELRAGKSPPAGTYAIEPRQVIRFQGRSGWFRRKHSARVTLTCLSPGESFASSNIDPMMHLLESMNGLVFFLDSTNNGQIEQQLHGIKALIDELSTNQSRRPGTMLNIPVAVCLSKIDLLKTRSALESLSWLTSLLATTNDPMTLKTLQTRSQLGEKMLPSTFNNIHGYLKANFRHVMYFPMSAFKTFGILEPLMWLLEMMGCRALQG